MYSFENAYGGAASAATMQLILDSGASHNVIPKEWVQDMQWGPIQGSAGFRTVDGTWIPNLGTVEEI